MEYFIEAKQDREGNEYIEVSFCYNGIFVGDWTFYEPIENVENIMENIQFNDWIGAKRG